MPPQRSEPREDRKVRLLEHHRSPGQRRRTARRPPPNRRARGASRRRGRGTSRASRSSTATKPAVAQSFPRPPAPGWMTTRSSVWPSQPKRCSASRPPATSSVPRGNRLAQRSIRSRADRAHEVAPHVLTLGADRRATTAPGTRSASLRAKCGSREPNHETRCFASRRSAAHRSGHSALPPTWSGSSNSAASPSVSKSMDRSMTPSAVRRRPILGCAARASGCAGPAQSRCAERRDRQEDVAQRAWMNDEGQRRSGASAASWRRPFVASAVPE